MARSSGPCFEWVPRQTLEILSGKVNSLDRAFPRSGEVIKICTGTATSIPSGECKTAFG